VADAWLKAQLAAQEPDPLAVALRRVRQLGEWGAELRQQRLADETAASWRAFVAFFGDRA
jgi:hypothetical protein